MTTSSIKKASLTTVLKIALVSLVLILGLGALVGCTNEPDTNKQDMLDYYNTSEVKAFHNDLQDSLSEVAAALSSQDKEKLDKATQDLDDLCDQFAQVSSVPDNLKSYHEKMLEVADSIKKFNKFVAEDDIDRAAEEIKNTQALIAESQALVPSYN